MEINWQILLLYFGGCFLGGLIFSSLTKWRVWVTAAAISIAAVFVGTMFDPITIELGNAIAAFLPALAGAALGTIIRRKRSG